MACGSVLTVNSHTTASRFGSVASAIALAVALSGSAFAAPPDVSRDVENQLKACGQTQKQLELSREATLQARAALARAAAAKAKGQVRGATLNEDTAKEWAALACDIVTMEARERAAEQSEHDLNEAVQQIKRAGAFLEEIEARRGRALVLLGTKPPADSSSSSAKSAPAAVTPSKVSPASPKAPVSPNSESGSD